MLQSLLWEQSEYSGIVSACLFRMDVTDVAVTNWID